MGKRGLLLAAVMVSWIAGLGAFFFRVQSACQRARPVMQAQLGAVQQKHICLPYQIPDTPLRVLELAIYDGIALEDGSVEEVAQVAALLIQNTGERTLETGAVELWQGERLLRFSFQFLPPGATVMALEADRRIYRPGQILRCQGRAQAAAQEAQGVLTVWEEGMCTLHITNTTGYTLQDAVLYFKNVDPESGIYMGGIAYEIRIHSLAPGQTHTCRPGYYVSGQSRIVNIKISGLPVAQAGESFIELWRENPANADAGDCRKSPGAYPAPGSSPRP